MEFSLELLAVAANIGIFLCLMAIPWVTGPLRPLVMFLGIGGVAGLLGIDLYVGVEKNDYDLAADLMLLNGTKAVFFFGVSWIIEKVLRTFFTRAKEQKGGEAWQEDELSRTFDRNIRGLKDPNAKPRKR